MQELFSMLQILFQKLIPHQCLGSIWSQRDKSKANGCPTVVATIDQFNAVIYRVQSTVLVESELKPGQRARLITKWIDVAQVSYNLRDCIHFLNIYIDIYLYCKHYFWFYISRIK